MFFRAETHDQQTHPRNGGGAAKPLTRCELSSLRTTRILAAPIPPRPPRNATRPIPPRWVGACAALLQPSAYAVVAVYALRASTMSAFFLVASACSFLTHAR